MDNTTDNADALLEGLNDGGGNEDLTAGLDDSTPDEVTSEVTAEEAEGDSGGDTTPAPSVPENVNTMTEREHLEARARALGVTFRSNISDDNLMKRVVEAEAHVAKGPEEKSLNEPVLKSSTSNPNPDIDRAKLQPSKSAQREIEAGIAWHKARQK